ncbi:hypothetical protein Bbelb_102190 [Branchiostoma belcheri]|nr:hypothetical protein Bbelb_102190 [Branchiostoma belcheri]
MRLDKPPIEKQISVTLTYSSASYSVSEDASAGQYVITSGDVTVTWTTSGGTTPFQIISPVGSPFQVDSTGAVTVASSSSLDYETTNMYVVTVRANDNNGDTDQATVTIMVTDAAEAPTFSNLPTSRAVPEDVSVGTAVFTLSAADQDVPAQTLAYTIVSQTPSDKFQLSGGVVQVGTALDYESEQTYTLTLRVEDDTSGTPLSAESTLTVTVNDVIDELPTFSASAYSGSVAENQAFGTTVTWDAAVSVTDGDDGDTISYSLSGDLYRYRSREGALEPAGCRLNKRVEIKPLTSLDVRPSSSCYIWWQRCVAACERPHPPQRHPDDAARLANSPG